MKFQGHYHQSMSQTPLSRHHKLIPLSLLIMQYIQTFEDDYNPELVAFLMDHSYSSTWRNGLKYGEFEVVKYQYQAVQALLCARMFPEYADC